MAVALLVACDDATLKDDADDPIPSVGKIDAIVSTNQGLYYVMTIASPLDGSRRALRRLQAKCDNYLMDFRSPQTQADLARRGAGLKHINAYLHPASSPEARQALIQCGEKARAEGIDFQITQSLAK